MRGNGLPSVKRIAASTRSYMRERNATTCRHERMRISSAALTTSPYYGEPMNLLTLRKLASWRDPQPDKFGTFCCIAIVYVLLGALRLTIGA